MTDKQAEARTLAAMLRNDKAMFIDEVAAQYEAAANLLESLHARVVELEAELVAEAARTANQKLRADQMSLQHDTQAALNRDARNQLAQLSAQLEAIGAGGVESLRKIEPMSEEEAYDLTHSAGPKLVELGQKWADNEIHAYQYAHQAEAIVTKAVRDTERFHGIGS